MQLFALGLNHHTAPVAIREQVLAWLRAEAASQPRSEQVKHYLERLARVDAARDAGRDQAREQLTREPRPLPQMKINPDVKSIFDFKFEDFELVNYDPHPHIAGAVAV